MSPVTELLPDGKKLRGSAMSSRAADRLGERERRGAVDGVADLGLIDDHGADALVALGSHVHERLLAARPAHKAGSQDRRGPSWRMVAGRGFALLVGSCTIAYTAGATKR